jgi:DNA-binding CsgD family transcriptional regulator
MLGVTAGPVDGMLPAPALLAHVPLCEAELARVGGQDQPDDWQRAIDAVDAFGLRFQGAYARFRLVESRLRTGGDRHRAAVELDEARATVAELGAAPLAAEIDRLARRSRLSVAASSPTTPSDGADDGDGDEPDDEHLGLSPRELQVLALVAEGATNRQVAEQLYISPKTASVHVSNILAKLGVSSRGEAAALARRLGVVTEP